MGYLRKALSIGTLGLSNLVLDDESQEAVKSPQTRARPRKRAKPKAKARAKAGAGRSRDEHKTARAKPRPARAKPTAATKRKTASRKRTGATPAAKASAKRVTARKANATKAAAAKTAAARTSARRPSAAGKPAARKPAASTPTARKPAASTPGARARAPFTERPAPAQAPEPDLQPTAQTAGASTTARASAIGNGVSTALERIATLHEHGALTDREFAAAKARILGTAPPGGGPEAANAFPAIEANVAAARRIDGYADPDREPSVTRPGAPGGI